MMYDHRIPAADAPRPGREHGFTLIELMIVLVVAAILTAIAVPMYLNQVRESRRTDARSALLDLAGREERFFATNSSYTAQSVNLGYGTGGWPQTIGSGYYQIRVYAPAGAPDVNPPAAPSYSITATAISTQTADACASLTVDSSGQQTAVLSSGGQDTNSTCWGAQ